ncbi:MAG TPA: PDGLE domain-containing protein [Caldisericia bacterium]|nr:PDGLE domain-containing protein [Caldisericia bacterium]HPF49777.1 PDGLE domain-containing protein [Caldisericia bacterium]HPI84338.1 PDGLE domain-containing protein [Caldisericia bacterium]HPQ93765.1 PDGLE domain-containing protein [Caldisericia bacterium]HRV74811.1 PDGLE domain-containing protein [Caldisericia bacterium]
MKNKNFWFFTAGLILAIVLAVFISPFASPHPDGLERVAEDKGFIDMAQETWESAPLPDYTVPGIENEGVSTATAGAIGTLSVFGVGLLVAFVLKKRND